MTKDKRSNKWTFLFYKESCPTDYLEVLEELHIPFILSPWHDKDINRQTGELKKAHKHGAFFFDSLKSYKQVSELIKNKLNGPAHVEVVGTGTYTINPRSFSWKHSITRVRSARSITSPSCFSCNSIADFPTY